MREGLGLMRVDGKRLKSLWFVKRARGCMRAEGLGVMAKGAVFEVKRLQGCVLGGRVGRAGSH